MINDSFLLKVATMEHNAAVATLIERPYSICYLEAERKLTHLYLENDTRFTINAMIQELEDVLPPDLFFYCGSSCLVNASKVLEFWATAEPILVISCGHILPVPLSEVQNVLDFLRNDKLKLESKPRIVTFR